MRNVAPEARTNAAFPESALDRDRGKPTVDHDVLPRHERRSPLGREPNHRSTEFVSLAKAGHRRVIDDLLSNQWMFAESLPFVGDCNKQFWGLCQQ